MKKAAYISAMALGLLACTGNKTQDNPPAQVSNVYELMRDYSSMDSAARADAYAADSVCIDAFMQTVSEMPVDDKLLEGWSNSNVVEVFTPAVDSVYGNNDAAAKVIGNVLANATANNLKLPRRRYAAVVYGRPESILFVDSVMLIALNHYLGADYPGYSHWPTYMRTAKTPENLPYDIAEALTATSYPYVRTESSTLLSRLLYEGALAHAKEILTGGDAAGALGYDEAEMKWLADNESAMWQSLVADRMLYDTGETVAERLVNPSPAVTALSPAAPGRAGRYIGYRIISAYLAKNPDASLPYLLSPDFYNSGSALLESGYGR